MDVVEVKLNSFLVSCYFPRRKDNRDGKFELVLLSLVCIYIAREKHLSRSQMQVKVWETHEVAFDGYCLVVVVYHFQDSL